MRNPQDSADPALDAATEAADRGDYESVVRLFHSAARPTSAEEADAWATLLVEAGAVQEARDLLAGFGLRPSEADEGGAGEAGSGEEDDWSQVDCTPRPEKRPGDLSRIVRLFLRWFAGRGDVYARQWYDARRDRSGYVPVREPLDASVAARHITGRITIGQYLLHPDETVSFAVLDLDPVQAALEQVLISGEEAGGLTVPALGDYAVRLRSAALEAGLSPALEDTGGTGLHLWLFFAPRIAAAQARAVLRELLFQAGPQPPAVNVEIFPKQDHLTGKGFGNLVKLPLGVHQATMRASSLLGDDLTALPAEVALGALRASDPKAVEALLRPRVVPLRPPNDEPPADPGLPPPLPVRPGPRPLAEALAAITPAAADAAADRMIDGCAVLRELTRHALEERRLEPDQARALLYTVGLAGRAGSRIEQLFAQAGVSRKELERARRGLPSPLGCARLRKLFPALAERCRCPEAPEGGYSTPALFAFRKVPPLQGTRAPGVPLPDLPDPEPTLRDVLRVLAEINRRLDELEARSAEPVPRRPEAGGLQTRDDREEENPS